MTKNQSSLYWRTWSKVRKTYIEFGGFSPAEADDQRHQIHLEAIGENKSSKDLDNRDLDRILDHFRVILSIAEGPANGPARAQAMPRRRLIWAIEQTALGDPYIAAIAADQFRVEDWRTDLTEAQLTALRWTCINRSRAKARPPVPAAP